LRRQNAAVADLIEELLGLDDGGRSIGTSGSWS